MNVEQSWRDQVDHQETRSRWENGLRRLTEAAAPPALEDVPKFGFITPKDLRELFYLDNDHPNVRAVQAAMRERLTGPFAVLLEVMCLTANVKSSTAQYQELAKAGAALYENATRQPVTGLEVKHALGLKVTVSR